MNSLPAAAFFDVDGTLIGASKKLSPGIIAAIGALEKAGVPCGVATGRAWTAAQPFVEALGMSGVNLCFAGAAILNTDGSLIFQQGIEQDTGQSLIEALRRENLYFDLNSLTDWFTDDPTHPFSLFHQRLLDDRPRQVDSTRILESENLLKITGIIATEAEAMALERIKLGAPDYKVHFGISPASNDLTFFNIVHKYATRELGLLRICEHTRQSPDKFLAAGDADGDRHFIRSCRYGIAMGNAAEEIRRGAPHVAKRVDEDGLALMIADLFPALF